MTDDNEIEYNEEKVLHLIERGRNEQAETTIGRALRTDPENEKVRFLLASVYHNTKRYFEAERLAIELIRNNPESSEFYTLYARIMLETLHIEKAGKLAMVALQFEPDNISALVVSILCNVIQSNKAEYQQKLFELVRNYPEAHATAAMMLAVLIEQKRHRAALRIGRELLRSDPTNEDIAEMTKELRVLTHPTMLPLLPVTKFGWHASAVLWVFALIVIYVSRYFSDTVAGIFACVWLFYVLYSWTYPPIIKKYCNRRFA